MAYSMNSPPSPEAVLKARLVAVQMLQSGDPDDVSAAQSFIRRSTPCLNKDALETILPIGFTTETLEGFLSQCHALRCT